jgi:hypothetical protein
MMLARILAMLAHEVVTEYRKLDAPPAKPGYDPASLPNCDTRLADQDDAHQVQVFGFGPDQRETLAAGAGHAQRRTYRNGGRRRVRS